MSAAKELEIHSEDAAEPKLAPPKQANQWIFAKNLVEGLPVIGEHLVKLTVDLPELEEGQVLVKVTELSVDPFQRTKLTVAWGGELGKPVFAGSAGTVVLSKHPGFPVGSSVEGHLGWVDAAVVTPEEIELRLLPPAWKRSHALGALGMPGITALIGIEQILDPQPGQAVFISAAAGAVGSLVGQICKHVIGCKVYGSVGSDRKVKELQELGFDGVLNYKGKTVYELAAEIKELTSGHSVDRYFDNTGGPMTDAVASLLSQRARIAVCGQISLFRRPLQDFLAPEFSSALFLRLLATESSAEGFLRSRIPIPEWNAALAKVAAWIQEGLIRVPEKILDGFDAVPEGLALLFSGGNSGKLVVRI